jgi:nucleoside-diphosphate-sugar epimerase
MRYAVTGGTGFVGSALIRTLGEAGHEVAALVRGDHALAPPVRIVRGDLFDAAALDRLCSGIDGLFHVAGWYKLGTRDPSAGRRVNVEGTRAVLSAAVRAGVPRVVYTSTLAVNSDTHGAIVDESYRFTGRHLSAYDGSKAKAHDVALEFARRGLPVVVVMPGLVYGPGDTAMTGHLIRDTMLAGPPAPLIDGLRLVARLAGGRPPIGLPRALVAATAGAADLAGRVLPLPPAYAAETLRSSLATYYGSPAKAVSELGWSCRDMDTGLGELVAVTLR